MMDNFAIFILTHGRPDRVTTYRTLRRHGYTGDIYIIVDNEDSAIDAYRKNFGEQVIVFDKAAIAEETDAGDNFPERNSVLYARNASFDIARDLRLDYFLQLDDDYYEFKYRFDSVLDFKYSPTRNLDDVFFAMLDYYKSIPALTICMGQGGDYIGGGAGANAKSIMMKRKAMNSFFCATDRPFKFMGRMNDDVNTYTLSGLRGALFLTIFQVSLEQRDTQQNSGGLTEMYMEYGTYTKSFYTVMYAPSCARVSSVGHLHPRIHHHINWNSAVPKIIAESYRKL